MRSEIGFAPAGGARGWSFRMSPVRIVLLAIAGFGLGAIAYRLVYGLGATTNLTDRWPWGLWIWWDVLTGVALAGGGYATALLVNFLGRERWRAVERGAFLTSLLGYLLVCGGLILDLGRWPNVWRAGMFWDGNTHSVMFELIWCVGGYTVVQLVEFGHIFIERVRAPRLTRVLARIYVPVLVVGVILPVLHQSALGSLFVITRGRLDPLWWSMLLPVFFLLSSFFVGPSTVTVESTLSTRAHGGEAPTSLLREMTRLAGWVMLGYLALRIGDLAWRGALGDVLDISTASLLLLLELAAGVLIPAVVFLRRRATGRGLVTASVLTILGVMLNRANVAFTALAAAAGGASYVPSWVEVAVTLGLLSIGVLAYLFVTENFPILPETSVRPVREAPRRRVATLRPAAR